MKQAVLGFGNSSKPVLESREALFPGWTFGVLDSWSVVQTLQVPEVDEDGAETVFFSDYSQFIEEPSVGLRFGGDKYRPSDTEKMLRFLPHYEDFLEAEKTGLPAITESLRPFGRIVATADLSAALATCWLADLLRVLAPYGPELIVLSVYPAPFQGERTRRFAQGVSEALMDLPVKHFTLFSADVGRDCGHMTLPQYFNVLQSLHGDALSACLRGEAPDPEWFQAI
ncbi:hypothetical protein [Flaviaesturariibacter aridisoli]|uniref:Uncharacterized protein n=1 Tax=Flaviaesturariibacter aridisoli TaxID=2545761 RepID=A0A4V2WML0_9BACT|nr:hypothetical protein [Flaviaesturariibacter aridisoli]TCZ70464.1 hypothetical protein E0486_10940 [Flaviaesturariibacter aridisoli]